MKCNFFQLIFFLKAKIGEMSFDNTFCLIQLYLCVCLLTYSVVSDSLQPCEL